MSALPAQVLTPPPSKFADVILEQKVCCFMKAAARWTAVVILSSSLHVYVSFTASVENLQGQLKMKKKKKRINKLSKICKIVV